MKITISIIFCLCILKMYAQDDFSYLMFWNNYSLHNSAATGLFYTHYATAMTMQSSSFPGSPKSYHVAYNYKNDKFHGGLGVNYNSESLGAQTDTKINLSYSYQGPLNTDKVLSYGLGFGILRKSFDFSGFHPISENDSLLSLNSKQISILYNTNLGAMFKTPRLLIGLSITQYTRDKNRFIFYKNNPVSYLSGSYKIALGKDFSLKPAIQVKTNFTSVQSDFNILTTYKNRYWAGLSYSSYYIAAIMAGIDIKGKYRIGYAQDLIFSSFAIGNHEIVFSCMID